MRLGKFFNHKHWNKHAVIVPYLLAKKARQGEIYIEPCDSFHYLTWSEKDLAMLFEEAHDFSGAYVHHLWESRSWDKYLRNLTVDHIKEVPTTYNLIARRFL